VLGSKKNNTNWENLQAYSGSLNTMQNVYKDKYDSSDIDTNLKEFKLKRIGNNKLIN